MKMDRKLSKVAEIVINSLETDSLNDECSTRYSRADTKSLKHYPTFSKA